MHDRCYCLCTSVGIKSINLKILEGNSWCFPSFLFSLLTGYSFDRRTRERKRENACEKRVFVSEKRIILSKKEKRRSVQNSSVTIVKQVSSSFISIRREWLSFNLMLILKSLPPISHIDFDIIIDLSMIILQLLTYSVNRFFFGSPYWYRLIVDDRSMIIPWRTSAGYHSILLFYSLVFQVHY